MLDTNILIYLMDYQPPGVTERFARLRPGDAGMSSITLAELRHGIELRPAYRRRDEPLLAALVNRVPAVPFDSVAAEAYGVIRAAVRERRRDALDALIAAHAISSGLTLVSNNTADFQDYPGLRLENWVA